MDLYRGYLDNGTTEWSGGGAVAEPRTPRAIRCVRWRWWNLRNNQQIQKGTRICGERQQQQTHLVGTTIGEASPA
jgi:hypothetical protein